jgi:hypothetical protein
LLTFGDAIAGIGATALPGTDLIVAVMDADGLRHLPAASLSGQEIDPSANVYLAGGAFAHGSVSPWSGRKQENLRAVLWLQFDADLRDYSGMPDEVLHDLPQPDIDRWIAAQRQDLEQCLAGIGLPVHRLDYTGYGLCAYLYLEPVLDADLSLIRQAHKAFIKAINQHAGIKLVDPQASDAGTRISRIPGSWNVKNPAKPRLVTTLRYEAGKTVTLDQVKFALRRAEQAPVPASMPQRTSLPGTLADEIVEAVRPHWTLGQKHALALALSGMLAKAGIPEEQALQLIERLSEGDTKPIDRVRCVQDTYRRLRSGMDNQGFMSLREMLPDTVLAYVGERLDQVRNATAPAGGYAYQQQTAHTGEKFTSSLNVAPVPDICFSGWVGDYVSMMLPLSEAPEQFHLAAGLGLIGASAGRSVSNFHVSKNLYGNLYLMIVGIAGYSRKDTAIEFAVNMPEHQTLTSHNSSPYQVLTDVGSPQGLMERLQKHNNIWLYITEYERLAVNAHRPGTPIFPLFTTAFNTPTRIENVTKGTPMEARFPYLSIIAAVQPEILANHMLPEDISSGFASRWLFIPGEGGEPLPSPPNIDEPEAAELYGRLLRNIGKYDRSDGRATRLEMSPDARERWDDWYLTDARTKPESDDEASMRSRLGVHIRKIALLYAVGDGETNAIQLRHLESAIAFVDWSWMHTREMLKSWGIAPLNALEVKIEAVLRQHGPMKRRELQNKTRSRRWGAQDFARTIEAMVRNGTISVDPEGVHGLA